MTLSTSQSATGGSENRAAQVVSKSINDILARWELRARAEIPGAAELPHPALINTIPKFLGNLAEALAPESGRPLATEGTNIPEEHGEARARLSKYGPDQLVQEYQLLREEVLNAVNRGAPIGECERSIIERSFANALRESIGYYSVAQSRLNEQFVSALTHDMRNPLSANKLSLEIMLKTLEKVEDESLRRRLKDLAARALTNVKRVDRMIQDLLDTNLIEAGQGITLRITECDLNEILEEIVKDLPPDVQRRVIVSGGTARGFWDGEALRRALENVISNAAKYGSPDTPIRVDVEVAYERVQASVHNFGNPIPLEQQSELFQPFHRSEGAKKGSQRGWGIGLSLSRAVTKAHGGSLVLESADEKGTTFTFDFPVDARISARKLKDVGDAEIIVEGPLDKKARQ